MELSLLSKYLIAVNIVGFVLYLINTALYAYTADKQIDAALTITSIIGGSLGILIAILIVDPKAVKGNMTSRVFIACVFVIQVIILLMLYGHLDSNITVAFWDYLDANKLLAVYLIVINIITLVAFGIDKIAAIEHDTRIRIVTLLGLAFIGGSIGALIGMYAFNHKTKKDYFTVGVPLIIIMQIVILFFLMNGKM